MLEPQNIALEAEAPSSLHLSVSSVNRPLWKAYSVTGMVTGIWRLQTASVHPKKLQCVGSAESSSEESPHTPRYKVPNANEEGKDRDFSRRELQPAAEENLSQFLKGRLGQATASRRNTISTNTGKKSILERNRA